MKPPLFCSALFLSFFLFNLSSSPPAPYPPTLGRPVGPFASRYRVRWLLSSLLRPPSHYVAAPRPLHHTHNHDHRIVQHASAHFELDPTATTARWSRYRRPTVPLLLTVLLLISTHSSLPIRPRELQTARPPPPQASSAPSTIRGLPCRCHPRSPFQRTPPPPPKSVPSCTRCRLPTKCESKLCSSPLRDFLLNCASFSRRWPLVPATTPRLAMATGARKPVLLQKSSWLSLVFGLMLHPAVGANSSQSCRACFPHMNRNSNIEWSC